jgi:hypothetical protein
MLTHILNIDVDKKRLKFVDLLPFVQIFVTGSGDLTATCTRLQRVLNARGGELSAPLLDTVGEKFVRDLSAGRPAPLLGEAGPPALLPLALLLVIELDTVQCLAPVPAPDHWNAEF